ncbi:CGNR zinc finger domain-containing protein [Ktedonospora formicarum]|nr:CGNR zinc finger domain-containing protein [Ktedonospora formicarum]
MSILNTTKNGSRHWCRMEGRGSRAKVRRQYTRKRHASTQDANNLL